MVRNCGNAIFWLRVQNEVVFTCFIPQFLPCRSNRPCNKKRPINWLPHHFFEEFLIQGSFWSSGPQFLCGSSSCSPRWVFARIKKRIGRAKPPRCKGLRKCNRADHYFFASLRLCESKKSAYLRKAGRCGSAFFSYRTVKSGSFLVYALFFAKSKMAPIPTPMDNPNPHQWKCLQIQFRKRNQKPTQNKHQEQTRFRNFYSFFLPFS